MAVISASASTNAGAVVKVFSLPDNSINSVMNVNVVNTGTSDAVITIYVSDTDSPQQKHIIEWELLLQPSQPLVLSCVPIRPTESIFIVGNTDAVVMRVTGTHGYVDRPNTAPQMHTVTLMVDEHPYTEQLEVITGSSGVFFFENAIDQEGDTVRYTVTSNSPDIIFGNNSLVRSGENVKYTISANPELGDTKILLRVTGTDNRGAVSDVRVFALNVVTDNAVVIDISGFAHTLHNTEVVGIHSSHTLSGMVATTSSNNTFAVKYKARSANSTQEMLLDDNIASNWGWLAIGDDVITVVGVIGTAESEPVIINVKIMTRLDVPMMDNITGVPSQVNTYTTTQFAVSGVTDTSNSVFDITASISNCASIASGPVPNGGALSITSTTACNAVATISAKSQTTGLVSSRAFPIRVLYQPAAPVLSGVTGMPTVITAGESITPIISGGIDPEGGILSYALISSNPHCVTAQAATFLENGMPVLVAVNTGCAITLTLTATSLLSGKSSAMTTQLSVVSQQNYTSPNIVGLAGIPSGISVGSVIDITLTGGVDPEGGVLTYLMTSDSTCISVDGHTLTAVTECTATISISATSSISNLTSTKTFSVEASTTQYSAPILTNVVGLPVTIAVGANTPITLSGGVDPEGGVLTYAMACNESCMDITGNILNSSCAVNNNSIIVITAESSASGLTTSISRAITTIDNGTIDVSGITISTVNTVGTSATAVPIAITGAVSPINGAILTYDIINPQPHGMSFTKTINILENEVVYYDVTITGSSTTTIFVKVTDNHGNFGNTVSKTIVINDPPDASTIEMHLPDYLVLGNTYNWVISDGTDSNYDNLTYSAVISPADDIVADIGVMSGTSQRTMKCSGGVRTFTITPTVYDGFASSTGTPVSISTIISNTIPNMSTVVLTGTTTPTVAIEATYSFTAATDLDGQSLTYVVATTGSFGASSMPMSPDVNFNLTATTTGVGSIAITATDVAGGTNTKTIQVLAQ